MFIRLISVAILLALSVNAWLLYERNRILETALATETAHVATPSSSVVSEVVTTAQVLPPPSSMVVDLHGYRLTSKVSHVMAHLSGLRLLIEEQAILSGEVPRFLSDLGVLYPDVNTPEPIEQVRLLSDGSLAALLVGGDNRWVVMRRQLLDGYPHLRWQCEVNFELRHGPTVCQEANIVASPIMAGFDCQRASSEIERFICRHDRLMQADFELNRSWALLQQQSPDAITGFEQRIWLLSLVDHCPRHDKNRAKCLDQMIRARKSQIDRLL